MNDSKSLRKPRVAHAIGALPKSGIRDFFELVIGMDEVVSLGVGEPDFVTPWHVRESAIYALEHGHTSYTSNLGLMSLREEICRYVRDGYQVEYDPERECIITVGVSEALDLILRAVVNPGDEVVYHEPCYVSYAPEITMAGGVPVPVVTRQENDFALDPDDLRAALTDKTKAVLLNFPCNPTGATLSDEGTREIIDILAASDVIVITDEIYSELVYDGMTTRSIAAEPRLRDQTIFLHGFSKAFAMTGFRIGYGCGPPDLIDAMMKIHQYSMLCAPIIAQEAAIEALKNGERQKHSMRDEYQQRRNVIVKRLNEMGLTCFKPRGAFYVFPNITSSGFNSTEFAMELLKRKKVAVVPGTAFGPSGEGHVRCAYAASLDNIYQAMDAMEAFLEEL